MTSAIVFVSEIKLSFDRDCQKPNKNAESTRHVSSAHIPRLQNCVIAAIMPYVSV